MLPGRAESHIRVALFCQGKVDPGGCQIGQMATAIHSQVISALALELFQLFLVTAVNPARGVDVNRLIDRFNFVFTLGLVGWPDFLGRPYH